jgi:hypothetical protein
MSDQLNMAAEQHSTHDKSPVGSRLYIYKIEAFKAGAEWQKEQSKELINLMKQLIAAYDIRYPNAKQLLVGYTNEQAIDKMNTLLERLQD